MSYDQRHRYPGVFHVDGHQDQECPPVPPPRMAPYWSSPAAHASHRRKSNGCLGISHSGVTVLLLLFLLVFTTLGFGAYQIHNLQVDLRLIHKTDRMHSSDTNILTPEKQVGLEKPVLEKVEEEVRPAAHVIGRIHSISSPKTHLLWEPKTGRAFTEGGVVYQDGALLVNHTGLHHVYSRVELMRPCSPTHHFVHSVFVRRAGRADPLMLMVGNRKDACNDKTKDSVWTSDSYLAAALHLQKQDRVFVNVSHPRDLSHNHYANFFGLYKI
ncbi:unnamed protein product [Arctogadus glacialis]